MYIVKHSQGLGLVERLVHIARRSIELPCVYKASAGLARLDERGPVVRAPESAGVTYEDQPTPRARDRDAESARVTEEAELAEVVGAGGGEDHQVALLVRARVRVRVG